jgi:Transcriptional regulators
MNRKSRRPNRPRIALLIESSRAFGRGLLIGIAKYVREHDSWSIFLQERGLSDLTPAWLQDWEGDGIIARVENHAMAHAIQRLKLPAVDLRHLLPNLQMPSVHTNDEVTADLAAEHLLERGFRHSVIAVLKGRTIPTRVGTPSPGELPRLVFAVIYSRIHFDHLKPRHFNTRNTG